jgi:hypothetical protein
MQGSSVSFYCEENQSLQVESVEYIFEIKRNGEKKPEGQLKISDLYSRSLIRKEQGGDLKGEFMHFIEMYHHLRDILGLFKQCHLHGFEISSFVDRVVKVKKNDLSNVKKLHETVQDYFEDLAKFVEEKQEEENYFFLNYLSGKQIQEIDETNIKGVLEYLKWWDDEVLRVDDAKLTISESIDPFAFKGLEIKTGIFFCFN